MADAWSPARYERFAEERARPFHDLVSLIQPAPRMRVVDLGCGTGELTRILHRSLHASETLGIDRSEAMLTASRRFPAKGLRFEQGDIATFPECASFDLVFSHAALQWLPRHKTLLTRLTDLLKPGGQLALQIPANHLHPAHRVAAAVAREKPYRKALEGYVRKSSVLTPGRYAGILDRLGYVEQEVRLVIYAHHLASREAVVDWMDGTGLTPYRERLTPFLYRRFLARYRTRLLPILDARRPFFFPFHRILMWARRGRARTIIA